MVKFAHHRKAPSHCLLHKKIKVLLHNPPPTSPPLHSHPDIVQKNANIQNGTPREENQTINKKKKMTTPHLEMQQRFTRY